MVLGVHLGENLLDAAFGVDDERRAQHTHVLAAVHRLFGPHAVGFAHRVVGVGEQREIQVVLVAETAVRLLAVGAYADDPESHPCQFGLAVAQAFGFERTARGVVLGVEIEYRALSSQIGKRQRLTVLGRGLEIGGHLPRLQLCHSVFRKRDYFLTIVWSFLFTFSWSQSGWYSLQISSAIGRHSSEYASHFAQSSSALSLAIKSVE